MTAYNPRRDFDWELVAIGVILAAALFFIFKLIGV
jgi:hypothetical protein